MNTDVVLELEQKWNSSDPSWNGAGVMPEVNRMTQKFDLMETANSSDGYMQIHAQRFTYVVNLAKTNRVAYFMPT